MKMTRKQKESFAKELLHNGEIVLRKESEWWNEFTNRKCREVLYHVRYNGEVWDVDFVNNRLNSLFSLSSK